MDKIKAWYKKNVTKEQVYAFVCVGTGAVLTALVISAISRGKARVVIDSYDVAFVETKKPIGRHQFYEIDNLVARSEQLRQELSQG